MYIIEVGNGKLSSCNLKWSYDCNIDKLLHYLIITTTTTTTTIIGDGKLSNTTIQRVTLV